MKVFRWQGLVVFSVLSLLILGFFSFFLDDLLKSLIEEKGSEIIKTQIEVHSVSTSIPDQSGGLKHLAVANPDDVMENAVEIKSISFNVDAGKAISKKVVIDEMVVDGIRFNQKRSTPAKAYKKDEKELEEEQKEKKLEERKGPFGFGEILKIKSPEEILKSEKLETLEAVENAKRELEEIKTKWENKLETDLSPKALDETRQKIEALQKKLKSPAGVEGAATAIQEVKTIQETIKGNLDKIKNLKEELKTDTNRAKQLVAGLKDMPQKDFERLRKKYSLDVKGGTNILGAVLGDEIKEKIDLFWKYYEMVSPYLGKGGEAKPKEEQKYVRGKGVFVKFKEKEPYPEFLIKHGKLSLLLFNRQIGGELKNLSDNQRVYGKPALISFNAERDNRFDNFDLQIKLDRTQPEAKDFIDLNVLSLKLNDVMAGEQGHIEKGTADIKSSVQIVGEKNMSGVVQANLSGLSLSFPAQNDNEIFNAVSETIASTEKFFVRISVTGTKDNYSMDIDSDLNKIISGAIQQVAKGKIQDFEKKLKASVFSSTEGSLSGVNDRLGGVLKVEDLLRNRSSAWDNLLKQSKEGTSPIPSKDTLPLPEKLKEFKLPF